MKKTPDWLGPLFFLLLTVGVLAGGYTLINKPSEEAKTEQRQIVTNQWEKEGEYYVTTWEYPTSPGNTGTVGFKVGLNQETITSADIEILTTNADSLSYQQSFKKELASAVVGKKVSELSGIDAIGGASSTTKQFVEAVTILSEQI